MLKSSTFKLNISTYLQTNTRGSPLRVKNLSTDSQYKFIISFSFALAFLQV